jgi:hypothetical protein
MCCDSSRAKHLEMVGGLFRSRHRPDAALTPTERAHVLEKRSSARARGGGSRIQPHIYRRSWLQCGGLIHPSSKSRTHCYVGHPSSHRVDSAARAHAPHTAGSGRATNSRSKWIVARARLAPPGPPRGSERAVLGFNWTDGTCGAPRGVGSLCEQCEPKHPLPLPGAGLELGGRA